MYVWNCQKVEFEIKYCFDSNCIKWFQDVCYTEMEEICKVLIIMIKIKGPAFCLCWPYQLLLSNVQEVYQLSRMSQEAKYSCLLPLNNLLSIAEEKHPSSPTPIHPTANVARIPRAAQDTFLQHALFSDFWCLPQCLVCIKWSRKYSVNE